MKEEENEVAERFMDMNADSDTITGIFVSGDDVDRMQDMVESIAKNANIEHKANCEHDDMCRGVTPYALRGLKSFLIVHPELSELERMAVVASLVFSLGAKHERQNGDGSEMLKSLSDEISRKGIPEIPPEMMAMARKAGFPSFEEFSERMNKLREEEDNK